MENGGGQVNRTEDKPKRFSQQRRLIYETLANTTAHPDVDAIFAEVKKKLPDIGIATVYRNLKQLAADGLVNTLETTKDCIHYDADVSNHAHFVCERCGKIKDLFIALPDSGAVEKLGYKVKREKLVFYGVCPECGRHNEN
jgi:ferric uptake regulator, fur family